MGQRLTVDILENGERIAIIYYHWSAYFDSTIYELETLKNDIVTAKASGNDVLLAIIDGLEKRGGGLGLDPRSRDMAKKKWPDRTFKIDINRNDGLIFIDEQDMDETYAMTEGTASIDIVTEEVITEVDLECGLHYDVKDLPCDPFKVMTFEELEKVYLYIDTVYEHLRIIQKAGKADDYVS